MGHSLVSNPPARSESGERVAAEVSRNPRVGVRPREGHGFRTVTKRTTVAVWLLFSGITASQKVWRGRHYRRKFASKEWHSKDENPPGKGSMPENWITRSLAMPDDADNYSTRCAPGRSSWRQVHDL